VAAVTISAPPGEYERRKCGSGPRFLLRGLSCMHR
jgi:hypothetical protein